MSKRLFFFAGEPSGDLHGSHVIENLGGTVVCEGVGGPRMRRAGCELHFPMEQFAVMGFSDVLKRLPTLWHLFFDVRDKILRTNPDGIVLIDSPAFTLRMAKALRKKGYQGKIIQLVCPSVWAWGQNRIDVMAGTLDLLLTLYPFEPPLFSHTKLKTEYIGNPVVEQVSAHTYRSGWRNSTGLKENSPLLALFPGSREGEIQRNLPLQRKAAALLQEHYPECEVAVSVSDPRHIALIQQLAPGIAHVPSEWRFELMRECRSAIAKSGTITLELAMHRCPTVVTYELSALNYWIAKGWLRLNLPHYCIVNILGGKEIFPEVIGRGRRPEEVAEQLMPQFSNPNIRDHIRHECDQVAKHLGTGSVAKRAADAIHEVL